ncbi:putative bifunctional diguanylate cyclase/phosphodiesterase [Pseudoneobacillus sp. C159]
MKYTLENYEVYVRELDRLRRTVVNSEHKTEEFINKLKNNESLNLKILDTLPINIFLEDREGRTLFANKQACKCNGLTLEELVGKTVYDFFPLYIANQNRADDLEVWQRKELITKEGMVGFQGKESYMYTGKTIIRSEETNEEFLLGFGLDITDRVIAEKRLRESEEKFRNLIEQAADSIFLFDRNGLIIDINPNACELIGHKKEELLFLNGAYLFTSLTKKMKRASTNRKSIHFEDLMKKVDGTAIPVDINLRLIQISETKAYLAVCRDISEKKKVEAKIKHMAYHDALTGLPNRWYLQSFRKMDLKKSFGPTFCIILLDLDHFKFINDSLGHSAGDSLLQEVGNRLKKLQKTNNVLARLGGDEFIFILPNALDETAKRFAHQIMKAMEQPFLIHDQKISITTSIGFSIYPNDGDSIDTLIKNADIAMYRSKDQGRNGYYQFSSSMMDHINERMETEMNLREALEKQEFILHYQPKINLLTGAISGAEALIRWQRNNSLIYPGSFISLAEETGLIVPIGEQVIRKACESCKEWHDLGFNQLTVSVNISASQFHKQNLEQVISRVLLETGLPPNALELELTESTVMKSPDEAKLTLKNLKSLGVKISIDDFGTGFSSLSYLKLFPIDTLKIDKSFIMNLDTDQTNAMIAKAVISLAHNLHLQVVAEGVENEEQLKFLHQEHCDYAQGYYVGIPISRSHFLNLLNNNKADLS